jgi:hypothetical protein
MSTITEHVAKTEEGSEREAGSESEVEFVWRPVGKELRRYRPLRPPHPPLKSQPDPEADARRSNCYRPVASQVHRRLVSTIRRSRG